MKLKITKRGKKDEDTFPDEIVVEGMVEEYMADVKAGTTVEVKLRAKIWAFAEWGGYMVEPRADGAYIVHITRAGVNVRYKNQNTVAFYREGE